MKIFVVTMHYSRKLEGGMRSDIHGSYNIAAKDDVIARRKAVKLFNKSGDSQGTRLDFCEVACIARGVRV